MLQQKGTNVKIWNERIRELLLASADVIKISYLRRLFEVAKDFSYISYQNFKDFCLLGLAFPKLLIRTTPLTSHLLSL